MPKKDTTDPSSVLEEKIAEFGPEPNEMTYAPIVVIPAPLMNPEAPDMPKKTVVTLAQIVVDMTKWKQNVAPPGTPTGNTAVNTYVLDPEKDGNISFSSLSEPTKGTAIFSPTMNESFGPDGLGADAVEGLVKGRRTLGPDDKKQYGGHEYLPLAQGVSDVNAKITSDALIPQEITSHGINEKELGGPPGKYVVSVLKGKYPGSTLEKNRFSSVTTSFNPRSDLKVGDKTYSRAQLSNIGLTLTTRASTEMGSTGAGYSAGTSGNQAKAILPGWNQLGAKPVQLSDLEVKSILDVVGNTSPTEIDILAPGLTAKQRGSWGQMNNPIDQYTGMSAFGMAALSVSLFLATATAVMFFKTVLLGFVMKSSDDRDPKNTKDTSQRRYLGSYGSAKPSNQSSGFPPLPMDSSFVSNALGLRQTNYNWSDCVEAGMLRFYGSSDTKFSPGSAATSITRALESPGFYSVVSRSMVRASVNIVASFNDIVTAFSSGNVMSGVNNLIAFFETIKKSKFIAALNVFASIGEVVISAGVLPDDEKDPNRCSVMDSKPEEVSSVTKSRLRDESGNQSLNLAWSSNRAISLLSVPSPLMGALLQGIAQEGPSAVLGVKGPKSRTYISPTTVANKARIDSDVVEIYEKALESEYVPFYFQDIRTNELVGFHAFLASLSDDYTAAWETMEGIGRADPVKIYKNTARKIGMSFYVVSTSESDFQEMWVKLNKLTTLVYPQYTEGRVVQDSDTEPQYRFIAPFTQQMGASPLIRIRLGDLLRSNYSKFAMARLFGMGTGFAPKGTSDADLLVKGKTFLTEQKDLLDFEKYSFRDTKTLKEKHQNTVFTVLASDVSLDQLTVEGGIKTDAWARLRADFDQIKSASATLSVKVRVSDNDVIYCSVIDAKGRGFINTAGKEFIKKWPNVVLAGMTPDKLTCPGPELLKLVTKDSRKAAETANEAFHNFMSEKENAIVKSFKHTGGKGLAGVIESMSFDWFDKITWETEKKGSKAPKACKVTLSFSPIHDIPPGLDVNGYNRAPLYPVGVNDGQSFSNISNPSVTLSDLEKKMREMEKKK
jgi:hypothetical protein